MRNKIILGLLLSAVFLFFIAIVGFGSGATGMSIVQSPGSVEFPGYIVFIAIIASLVGFVFIKSYHDRK
jgi:hypothetical protein